MPSAKKERRTSINAEKRGEEKVFLIISKGGSLCRKGRAGQFEIGGGKGEKIVSSSNEKPPPPGFSGKKILQGKSRSVHQNWSMGKGRCRIWKGKRRL